MDSFWDLLKSFIKWLVLLNLSLIKWLLNDGKGNLNELEAPKKKKLLWRIKYLMRGRERERNPLILTDNRYDRFILHIEYWQW